VSSSSSRIASAKDGVWLAAVELRVDADLAVGRHAELATELPALVRRHPFRERLRAHLMLALYRSDRQAEALEAFSDGRRRLADELGLEPSPALRQLQQQILEQDPALTRPAGPPPAPRPRRRAAAAAVALAAAIGVLVLRSPDADEGPTAPPPGVSALATIDAGTGHVERRVALGSTPAAVALSDGAAWVVDADEQTVARVDQRTGAVATFATGATPTDIATGAGAVWVGNGRPLRGAQFRGPVATAVARVDPATRTVRARAAVAAPARRLEPARRDDRGRARRGVGDRARRRARAHRPAHEPRRGGDPRRAGPRGRCRPGGSVAARGGNTIVRVDRDRNAIVQRARSAASAVGALALGAGSAWVSVPGDGTL